MSEFYDENWLKLQRRYSLVARKLEDLRCEVPSIEEFEELLNYVEELAQKVDNLTIKVDNLMISLAKIT